MAFLQFHAMLDGYIPLIFISLIASALILNQRRSKSLDPQEPPLLRPTIPVIGHLIGLFWYQKDYFSMLCKRSPHPAFTISIFGSKTYVVASPELTQVAVRSKSLVFGPLYELGLTAFGLNEETAKIVLRTPENKNEKAYPEQISDLFHDILSLGPALDKMNARMLNKIAASLNEFPGTLKIDSFYPWLRHIFTLATCSSVFGDHDPFSADPAVENALWDFDAEVLQLLVGKYPSVIARKGYRARKTVQAAFLKYLEAGHFEGADVSAFYRERVRFDRKIGLKIPEMAKISISIAWAATANAIPTIYWIILYVFSSPKLAEELHNEVSGIVTVTGNGANRNFEIDITKFNSDLPLLMSVYQEVLRLTNSQISVRFVQTDTRISAGEYSYLLKKGAMMQLPTAPLHSSISVWGPDADQFNPRRFLKKGDKEKRSALMPFGGGKHLCPGRHFAAVEIVGVTTALILGFRVLDEQGAPISVVNQISNKFTQGTGRPIGLAEALGVNIVRREGMEQATFGFKIKA